MTIGELKKIIESIEDSTKVGMEISTQGDYVNVSPIRSAELIKMQNKENVLVLFSLKFMLSDN